MNVTTFQIIALLGSLASLALLFGIGYHEGRRAARNDLAQATKAHEELIENLRHQRDRAVHEHTLSRLNAAQALEAITSELDECRATLANLQGRVITEDDANQLVAMADKLSLAANVFAGIGSHDQATAARKLSTSARALFDRYWQTLPVMEVEVMA